MCCTLCPAVYFVSQNTNLYDAFLREVNIKSFSSVDQIQYLYIPYLHEDKVEAGQIS